jgi:hypothetical protein
MILLLCSGNGDHDRIVHHHDLIVQQKIARYNNILLIIIFKHLYFIIRLENNFASGNITIIPPHSNKEPYQLRFPTGLNEYGGWAQAGQDQCAFNLLNQLKNGYFIEAGAYDGEEHSNTLWLEKTHTWTGLLIEPNIHLFHKINKLNRKCSVVNSGISPTNESTSFPFKLAGPLGGIVSHYSHRHEERANTEIRAHKPWMDGDEGKGLIINVPCYPLEKILLEAGNHDLVVDFFSLDTEGSEAHILKSINFKKITFGIIIIEHNNEEGRIDSFKDILIPLGYVEHLHFKAGLRMQDVVFVNPSYFKMKNTVYNPSSLC